MTDNEIVKALECCVLGYCRGCFYGETDQRHCKDDLMTNALDLINRTKAKEKHYRQKVQNQRETINALQDKIKRQQAEIESLTVNMNAFGLGMKREAERANTARAEAVKEFAERLCEDRVPNDPVVIAVKCELKEMVGEEP